MPSSLLINAEMLAYQSKRHSIGPHLSSLPYLLWIKFGAVVFYAMNCNPTQSVVSVLRIVGTCTPLKVLKSIVAFVSVLVIALRLLGIFSNKCQQHKSVNVEPLLNTLSSEIYGQVTGGFTSIRKHRATARSSTNQIPPYVSKIRDTVNSFVSRNVFPDFRRIDWGLNKCFRRQMMSTHNMYSLIRLLCQTSDASYIARTSCFLA